MLALLVLLSCLLPSPAISVRGGCRCRFPLKLTGSLSWNKVATGLTATGSFWVDLDEGYYRAVFRTSESRFRHRVFVDLNSTTWFYVDQEGCHTGQDARFHLLPNCVPFDTDIFFGCAANGNQMYTRGTVEMDDHARYEILLGCASCTPQKATFRDSFGPELGSIVTEYSRISRWEEESDRRFFTNRIRCARN